jgi:hypothetical protein
MKSVRATNATKKQSLILSAVERLDSCVSRIAAAGIPRRDIKAILRHKAESI